MMNILKQYTFRIIEFLKIDLFDWLMEPRFKNDHLGKTIVFLTKRKIDL